jgi:SAM-dependent methyltransferase
MTGPEYAQEYAHSVNAHYGRTGLAGLILDALRAAGKDASAVTPGDLAPVDQFHTGGKGSTEELAALAGVREGVEVLDVGGGIGGAARTLAREYGCRVTVLDITEEYCRTGELLTAWTALEDRVRFRQGSALAIPFPAGSFDLVWTQHSSMNIEDKRRLYTELYRVLRPGGRLALHEIMAGAVQPIHFPVPWASEPAISHLLPPDEVRALLAAAGFTEAAWNDATAESTEWFRRAPAPGANAPPLGLHLLLGAEFPTMIRNLVRNLEEGRVAVLKAVLDRP